MATMMAMNPSHDQDDLMEVMIMPKVTYRGESLSEAQVGVLNMIGKGRSNQEIARVLGISRRTVESHLCKIRNLIARVDGHRPRERDMVIFAKDMRDGYKVFCKLTRELEAEENKLIEDWDEEESYEPDENEVDKKIIDLDRYRPKYEISDFCPEDKDIHFVDGKYFLF